MQIYLNTPLGPGSAQISPSVVQYFLKARSLMQQMCL